MMRSMIVSLIISSILVIAQATEQTGLRRLRDRTVIQIDSKDEVSHVMASLWGADGKNKQTVDEIDFKGFFERNLMSVSMSMSM
jgi:hypothetical protein